MPLGNTEGGFAYVNIKKGKLVIKKGEAYETYGYLEGYLKDIAIRQEEYQGETYLKLCLEIDDGRDSFQLQMRLDSGYGRAFCNMIMNVDLAAPLRIQPTFEEVDGKQKSGMFIRQNNQAVKWYFTKDHPHDLPPMKKITFRGKEGWDNTDQINFYVDLLLNKIKPQISRSVVAGPPHEFAPASNNLPNPDSITEPLDDLPF